MWSGGFLFFESTRFGSSVGRTADLYSVGRGFESYSKLEGGKVGALPAKETCSTKVSAPPRYSPEVQGIVEQGKSS